MNDSKVKILHVTFNMGIGGTEQVIRQIIENSDPERFQHEILCIDGIIGALGEELQSKGIYIEYTQRKPGTDLKLAGFIRSYIRRRKVNVLHCHQYTPYFYGVLGAMFSKTKVVLTEHGRFYPEHHSNKRRFINPLLALASTHLTAISRSTADALSEYEYFKRGKIKVIYNGIKDLKCQGHSREQLLNELNLKNDNRYIGTISRLEPIKNQAMMLKAFHQVKKKVTKLKLVIIGDGAKMQDLKKLAITLGIEEDVIFTGFLNNPQRYISLFEIFLLSSFSEGTSMTLLEAMSLSKPCVVTNVGGNPEIIIHGETGLVVSSDDGDAFARSIMQLLADGVQKNKLGESGRLRFLKYFSAAHMIESYQSLYVDV